MALSEQDTITRDEVNERIGELEENRETSYRIVRDRNGEVLEEDLDSEEDAAQYLEDNDYDSTRFTIEPDGGLDDDDQSELNSLREFKDECDRDAGDFRYGATLYSENISDSGLREILTERIANAAGTTERNIDLDASPFNLIDLDSFRGDIFSSGSYGSLNGVSFYSI